jgi:CheY-like chemotaxis protein
MKGQILFIDDNEMDVKIATLALEKLGYECCGFTEFVDGLKWADSNVPQAVLLDIHMPGTTGYKLIPQLRKKKGYEKVPIIIVSGNNQAQDVRQAIKAGAIDYIIKPIDPLVLQDKVQRAQSAVGQFAEVQVPSGFWPNSHFMMPTQIVGLSEFGIRIKSTQSLPVGETVELGGLSLEDMGFEQVWMRCLSAERTGVDWTMTFSFIGISEKERQILRRTCRKLFVQLKDVG